MQLRVLPDEYFTCRSCTDCCRNYYVELFDREPEKIEHLAWPTTDPLHSIRGTRLHAGKTYLAHQPDGACVFLNIGNGLCRIHEQFGVAAKPMACRLYPFQVTPTFENEASVTARYDCPKVRQNDGEPHAAALPLIRQYTSTLPRADGFSEQIRCHLDRDQISAVTEFASTFISAFGRNDQRALFLVMLAEVLSLTAVDELDRPALASLLQPLKAQVEALTSLPVRRPGSLARMAFRTLLALHLRRDEDVLDRRAGRLGRLFSMMRFVLGGGSFRGLGLYHPPGSLRRAALFSARTPTSVDLFGLLWRLVRSKLEAFEFIGQANGGRDFLTGFKSLALLYPLVLTCAKYRAANRQSPTVELQDVDYAVAAIEHSFGRTATLSHRLLHPIETLLLSPNLFNRLVQTL